MKTYITATWRTLLRGFYAFIIAVTVLWAVPRIAKAQFYIVSLPSYPGTTGIVSEYSAKGELINGNFITGLNNPYVISVSDNNLFVLNKGGVDPNSGAVGKYDATTGGAITSGSI